MGDGHDDHGEVDDEDLPDRPRPEHRTCPACGAGDLEEGYLDERGSDSAGYVRWIEGALVRGRFGGVKSSTNPRWLAEALRCPRCGLLSLYATRRI